MAGIYQGPLATYGSTDFITFFLLQQKSFVHFDSDVVALRFGGGNKEKPLHLNWLVQSLETKFSLKKVKGKKAI